MFMMFMKKITKKTPCKNFIPNYGKTPIKFFLWSVSEWIYRTEKHYKPNYLSI